MDGRDLAHLRKIFIRLSVVVAQPKQSFTLATVALKVNDGPAAAVASETRIGK